MPKSYHMTETEYAQIKDVVDNLEKKYGKLVHKDIIFPGGKLYTSPTTKKDVFLTRVDGEGTIESHQEKAYKSFNYSDQNGDIVYIGKDEEEQKEVETTLPHHEDVIKVTMDDTFPEEPIEVEHKSILGKALTYAVGIGLVVASALPAVFSGSYEKNVDNPVEMRTEGYFNETATGNIGPAGISLNQGPADIFAEYNGGKVPIVATAEEVSVTPYQNGEVTTYSDATIEGDLDLSDMSFKGQINGQNTTGRIESQNITFNSIGNISEVSEGIVTETVPNVPLYAGTFAGIPGLSTLFGTLYARRHDKKMREELEKEAYEKRREERIIYKKEAKEGMRILREELSKLRSYNLIPEDGIFYVDEEDYTNLQKSFRELKEAAENINTERMTELLEGKEDIKQKFDFYKTWRDDPNITRKTNLTAYVNRAKSYLDLAAVIETTMPILKDLDKREEAQEEFKASIEKIYNNFVEGTYVEDQTELIDETIEELEKETKDIEI